MPTKEELEAELDRERRDARKRVQRSRRVGRTIGLLVLLGMGIVGVLSFSYLLLPTLCGRSQFSVSRA